MLVLCINQLVVKSKINRLILHQLVMSAYIKLLDDVWKICISLPFSKMFPGTRPMTTIMSAFLIVESLCAMTRTVLPFISLSSAS